MLTYFDNLMLDKNVSCRLAKIHLHQMVKILDSFRYVVRLLLSKPKFTFTDYKACHHHKLIQFHLLFSCFHKAQEKILLLELQEQDSTVLSIC